jgi:hypothetical protein
MRKEMIPIEPEVDRASTGELITRLTRETKELIKAEIARLKLRGSTIVGPVVSVAVLALVGVGTFALGLLGFGVALFSGIHALTGSAWVAGLVVGAVAWVFAGIAGAICAAVVRAIPLKLKQVD